MRVATDVGGTFTDLVYSEGSRIGLYKADTTPGAFEQGVLDAIQGANLKCAEMAFFAHGSTVVINALTERKGVNTALITTEGFRDVLEIARGNVPDIFNISYRKPAPFVRRRLRKEVRERIDYQGNTVTPLDVENLQAVVDELRGLEVEAIAVCYLHAYKNPRHEIQTLEYIRRVWPEVDVIASCQVTREWREYERTNTTVMSAYVLPVVKRYIERLASALQHQGLPEPPYIMQSNGGIANVQSVERNPITLVESGPVGGILGAAAIGALLGERNLITLDIGGTTAKCSLIEDGVTRITTEYVLEKTATWPGYPLKTPVIDIVEIGNGGGSLAWVDAAGSLRVGPQSAGSKPGPVAYGQGGASPTITDANLLVGRISQDRFAGGAITPAMEAVQAAFAKLGERFGESAEAVALGVLKIANANMVNALKLVSINRGHNPRDFSLIAFGGGGPLHAALLARELGMTKVIVPPNASVFSAWGMLMLDLRRDYIQTDLLPLTGDYAGVIAERFSTLEREARTEYQREGFGQDRIVCQCFIDARYKGQEHTVKVPLHSLDADAQWISEVFEYFHQQHEKQYTFRLDAAIEIVNFHIIAYGLVEKSTLETCVAVADAEPHLLEHREVNFGEGLLRTPVYRRDTLAASRVIEGPVIVEESNTATLVPPGCRVQADRYGALRIEV